MATGGSALAEQLALSRPERVAAVHLLDVPYHHQFMVDTQDAKDDAERAFLTAVEDWGDTAGYVAIQSTQPLTLGYGLADSPAGLLSWIGEKYTAWTDRQPDPDDVLTQASIYWFTNTIYSSMRLYAEGMDAWDADGTDRATGDAANWAADASAPEGVHRSHVGDAGRSDLLRRRGGLVGSGVHRSGRGSPSTRLTSRHRRECSPNGSSPTSGGTR